MINYRPDWADEVKRYSFFCRMGRHLKIAVVDCTWDEALMMSKLFDKALFFAADLL